LWASAHTSTFHAQILVFKTNAAYGRWDEARKAWGLTVNHSRNLARMSCAWSSSTEQPDPILRKAALDRMAVCIWSFPRSLQRHLLGEVEDGEEYIKAVRKRCPSAMAEGLIAARHKPSRALYELSNAIDDLPMPYLRRIELDKSCVEFANAMGAMDRIFSSPVPLVYTRHTARFLGGWILGMPLGLWSSFGDVSLLILLI
jgi:ion channel-forming bestrophin family protein